MELSEDYKLTEIGTLPSNWLLLTLDELAHQIIDGTHHTPHYTKYGIPFLRVTDIQNQRLAPENFKYISRQEHEILRKRCNPQKGDLLLSKNGTIGISKVINWNWEFSIFVSLALIKLKTERLLPEFLDQFFKSNSLNEQIRKRAKQGTVINLHLEEIRDFLIPLPPTQKEQESIAEILSDVDTFIINLETLISKKRDIKQGMMQELLKPKDSWTKIKLGDVGNFLKGNGVKKDQTSTGNIPCIRYGEIYTKHDDYIKRFYSWISGDVAKSATLLKSGDLLFAGSGETKEEIGKCVAYISPLKAYAGGDIVILRPQNIDTLFMGYYLNTLPIKKQKASRGQGDAVVHIGQNALADIDIIIPVQAEEQNAIASILSDIDRDIAALEIKLEKARLLKQGMMSELLTGRIRLV